MRLNRLLFALAFFTLGLYPAWSQDAPSPQQLCDAVEVGELTTMQFQAPEEVLEADTDYRAIFCTSAGAIYVDLYERLTPDTVNNFVFLAQQGYYDSTTFHRVIPNFMAQAGDPTATGRGGPGYQFGDEPVGFLTFDRPGLLAMANAGPGTNGSQFFITTAPTPHLNYRHTIFGDVLVGQDVAEAIRERDPQTATEPGEGLLKVLIITDHSEVDNSDLPELARATQEDVVAVFESFAEPLPPALQVVEGESGLFSTEALAATVAEDLQDGFATFAEARGHQYRYRVQIENADCDASVFFSSLGYWVDVYADAESSSAALDDEFMWLWLDSFGYERDDASAGAYRRAAKTCDGAEGAHVLALLQRGRFLATIDILVGTEVLDQIPAKALLDNLAFQIEGQFTDIYRPEIR